MNVTIQKLNGLWHLIVGSCQIRTPFLETQDRALAVAYARRVYPGAKILRGSTHAGPGGRRGSTILVRVEDVVLRLHGHMARVSAV